MFSLKKVKHKLSKLGLSEGGDVPTYSSDTTNNGIIGYADKAEFICNEEHPVYLVFGDHTRSMNIARKSFSVLDNVKVLEPCIDNDEVLMYLSTVWEKCIPNLGYSRHWKIAKDRQLNLPIQTTKDNTPILDPTHTYHKDGYILDFSYMESYIRATEKLVIADVVRWKDEEIKKTKEILSKDSDIR